MHLDEERLQRFLHAELPEADRQVVDLHLGTCEQCRARVDTAAREEERIFALLSATDHPVPAVDVSALLNPSRPRAAHRFSPGLAPGRHWQRWAAAVLIATAVAGFAYALPSSPVRKWIDHLFGNAPSVAPTRTPEPPTVLVETAVSGLSVAPTAHFTVRFTGLTERHAVRVTLRDTQEVHIRAIGDQAAFTSEVDHVSVRPGEDAAFEIELPRNAPWIDIVNGDHLLFRKEKDRITTTAALDSAGNYHLRP